MSTTKDLGAVTAYASAVEGGYTGTYEDFCKLEAGFAEAAAQVKADATAAAGSVADAKSAADNAKYWAEQSKNIVVQADQNIAKEVERATAAENKLESEKANKTTATSSADGLMSAADKTKLDGINPSAIATNTENIKKNADEIAKLNSATAEYRLMINPETGHMALAHYTKEA